MTWTTMRSLLTSPLYFRSLWRASAPAASLTLHAGAMHVSLLLCARGDGKALTPFPSPTFSCTRTCILACAAPIGCPCDGAAYTYRLQRGPALCLIEAYIGIHRHEQNLQRIYLSSYKVASLRIRLSCNRHRQRVNTGTVLGPVDRPPLPTTILADYLLPQPSLVPRAPVGTRPLCRPPDVPQTELASSRVGSGFASNYAVHRRGTETAGHVLSKPVT